MFPVQLESGKDSGTFQWTAPLRHITQFMYKTYKTGSIEKSGWSATKQDVVNACQEKTGSDRTFTASNTQYQEQTPKNMEALITDGNDAPSNFLRSFYEEYNSSLYVATTDAIAGVGKYGALGNCYDLLYADNTGDVEPRFSTKLTAKIPAPFKRVVKCYQTSKELEGVADVLGIREGTDFGVYATMIYLTYIDWYGLKEDSFYADVDDDGTYSKETIVVSDGVYEESKYRSAPYFDIRIDGIHEINPTQSKG